VILSIIRINQDVIKNNRGPKFFLGFFRLTSPELAQQALTTHKKWAGYRWYMYKLHSNFMLDMQEQPHILLEEKEESVVDLILSISLSISLIDYLIDLPFKLHLQPIIIAFYLISYFFLIFIVHSFVTAVVTNAIDTDSILLHKETILLIDPRQGNELIFLLSHNGYFTLAGFVFEYSKVGFLALPGFGFGQTLSLHQI
ncbi:hypothetical protein ACJX0J_023697, partial [Zea mays]